MKRLIPALVIGAVLMLSACGGNAAAPAATDTPAPTAEPVEVVDFGVAQTTPEMTPQPTPTPSPTPTPIPVNRSLTSGKEVALDASYRPVMVSIENEVGARPQVGLNMADIIYEFPVESSITRFQVLFNDQYPTYCGPVRSTRNYFVDLSRDWGCMYVHDGYGPMFGDYIPKLSSIPYRIYRGGSKKVDKKTVYYSSFYWRTNEKKATEHTEMVDLQELVDTLYGDFAPTQYERFLFQPGVNYASGEAFTRVGIPFVTTDKAKVEFSYNASTNTLTRYEDGSVFKTRAPSGTGHSAQLTTENVTVQNLIVQYCEHSLIPQDEKGRRIIDVIGTGKCDYFVNGRHVTGYWSRASAKEPTYYYLDSGELVTLEPGRTWIAVNPSSDTYAIRIQ